ncbi:hypothetical protein M3X86_10340 [Klebsiella pneumoniae]|nr:hypothetical protein M3X86_10340 [Klebsiella pneumoniae]
MRSLKMPWVLRKAWRRAESAQALPSDTGNPQTLNDALKELAAGDSAECAAGREHQQSAGGTVVFG